MFGDQYRRYREQVSMLIPRPARKGVADDSPGALSATSKPLIMGQW
jgi:hypothetical protein